MDPLLSGKGKGRDALRRAPSRPSPRFSLTAGAVLVAVAVIAATAYVLSDLHDALVADALPALPVGIVLVVVALASLVLLAPAIWGLILSGRAARARDLVDARVFAADARLMAFYTFGYSGAVVLALALILFVIANDQAVAETFFSLPLIFDSFWLILRAFWTNVYISVVAEVIVLVWGLVLAVARLMPGPAGRPIRAVATVYTDAFRGLPAIITIYLVGFGLPLTGLPIVQDFEPTSFAIFALVLTYGAYVGEVYRSGIDSIHWSQTAAARSLGFSYGQTLRFVVVPQAVRRIMPPLLNDFIALQKDTALVNVIGAIDAFNQAKIVASNHFNLSSVTTVAFLFIIITIPQARFVERLVERDQRRMRAGG